MRKSEAKSPVITFILGIVWFIFAYLWYWRETGSGGGVNGFDWFILVLAIFNGIYFLWLARERYRKQ